MKLKNITPKQFRCLAGGCPAVFETGRYACLIIGCRQADCRILDDGIGHPRRGVFRLET